MAEQAESGEVAAADLLQVLRAEEEDAPAPVDGEEQ